MRRDDLAARRESKGFSQEGLAHHLGVHRTTVQRWESGTSEPQPWQRPDIADVLGVTVDELDRLLAPADVAADWTTVQPLDLDDLDALELVRRVEASDTGSATMEGLEQGTDLLCRSYTSTMPAELLVPLRAYRSYAVGLLDGRATLAQRRELIVTAGWLSLLTAICHTDLRQYRAAAANLHAAHSMAREAEHSVLTAWAHETEAWQAITRGNPRDAVPLCEAAVDLVPTDTSAYVQITMQQARASALLHLRMETRRLLDQTADSLDRMSRPEYPEHHFTFDPRKLVSYTATALAWLGEDQSLAEDYARRAVAQYDVAGTDGRWRSRLASARLDLALILARAGEPGEAAQLGALALASRYLRPSNLWRAEDLDCDLASRYPQLPEAVDYHERLASTRPALPAGTNDRSLPSGG